MPAAVPIQTPLVQELVTALQPLIAAIKGLQQPGGGPGGSPPPGPGDKTGSAGAAGVGALAAPFNAMAGAASGVAEAQKNLMAGFSSMLAPLTGITSGFSDLIGEITPFVAALSPVAMNLFNESLRNLQATIGQALLPIIQVLTNVFNEASGALGPAMREIAPVIGKLAQVLTSAFVPNMQLLASVFLLLAPVIELVTDALEVWQDILRVGIAAITALVDVLRASGFLTFLKGIQEGFLNILKEMIKGVILFGAAIAKFLGISLAPLIDNLTKEFKKDVAAAPQNAAISTWEQIRQQVTTSAFIATGEAGAGKKTDDFLKDMITQLQQIESGQKGVGGVLKSALDGIGTAIGTMATTLVDKGMTLIREAIGGLPGKVKDALHIP